MDKIVLCSGNCGRKINVSIPSHDYYYVNGGYYCQFCAAKLPKYIMKKCSQCDYFGTDEKGQSFCKYNNYIRYIDSRDDACEKYERTSYFF